MGLYLGKKKLCSYNEKKIEKHSMKMFFDSVANSKYNYTSSVGDYPPLAGSSATSMDGWFLPDDTENVTSMRLWFQKDSKLTSAPEMNTSKVTNMSSMFYDCNSLASVPIFDTSKVTNMSYMFGYCYVLTYVPAFDTSNVTNMSSMFKSCRSLTAIHMTGMKVSFDISSSTLFTEEALVEILNNLATVTSTQTLTMGSTNLAKLTDDEKAIATGKGWTLK